MDVEWLLLAELTPEPDGYETSTATDLMRRVEVAVHRCGERDEVARVRVVLGEGQTRLRLETCSHCVYETFNSLAGAAD